MDGNRKTLEIDSRLLTEIRDTANRIWQETRKPNANLIMFEALRRALLKRNLNPQFTVKELGDSK